MVTRPSLSLWNSVAVEVLYTTVVGMYQPELCSLQSNWYMLVKKKLSQFPKSRDKGSKSTLRELFIELLVQARQLFGCHLCPLTCDPSFKQEETKDMKVCVSHAAPIQHAWLALCHAHRVWSRESIISMTSVNQDTTNRSSKRNATEWRRSQQLASSKCQSY